MTKLKAPFLSLAATGTVANILTTSKHPSGTVAKRIPTHPDPQTLLQLYQRWKFRDAQFAWHALTQSQKDAYRDLKYPPRMTAQQRHTREYLLALTDLTLWLTLDEPTGQTLRDISRHANHGTAIGTNSVPAIIDRGRYFDGIDDHVNCGNHPSLDISPNLTITTWLKPPAPAPSNRYILAKADPPIFSYNLVLTVGLTVYLNGSSVPPPGLHSSPLPPAVWTHYAGVITGNTAVCYLNGLLDTSGPVGPIVPNSIRLCIGARWAGFPTTSPPYWGALDDFRLYNRALSPAHIAYIHSQELYPKPN